MHNNQNINSECMFVVNASAYYSNNKRRLFIVITCNNRKEKLLENMKSSNKIVCLLILRDRSESILYAKYLEKHATTDK